MHKSETLFVCRHCDAQFAKWTGRCLTCGQWGTVSETKNWNTETQEAATSALPLSLIRLTDAPNKPIEKIKTGIRELDRVLGGSSRGEATGGLVPGSAILLGGEPGIGKSTLALQMASAIPGSMIFSGEESAEQIMLRAQRMGLMNAQLSVAHTDDADAIAATIQAHRPACAIVDSIQTVRSSEATGEVGSVSQVRAAASVLVAAAKRAGTALVMVGHITKDGALAGPKTLEHMVDSVLSFEGDAHRGVRVLRSIKNRFGSTNEIGMFDMNDAGISEIANPSKLLIESRGAPLPGSILTCLIEGSRPMIVEIQALVSKTAFGYPVRKASGFDINRLHLLAAVLERRAGLHLSGYDIHINVAGGIDAREPAADIAVALALASAYKDKALGLDLVAFGEVGLGGELKGIPHTEKRLAACADLGLARAIVAQHPRGLPPSALRAIPVHNVSDLIAHA